MIMKNNTKFSHLYPYIFIISFAMLTSIFLIANPSYYSHDELQKLDHVYKFGLNHYISQYCSFNVGHDFGVPIRPFAFFIQGLLALFMENYPVVVHLFAVISHALVACLLYTIILRLTENTKLSLMSAIIFIFNPMTIIATGWSAALMDRLYILFGLIAFLYADKYLRDRASPIYLIYLLFAGSLALISKETALVLPLLLIIVLVKQQELFFAKRFWLVTTIWLVPGILFFIYRLPALINSFNNPIAQSYKASFSNVTDNVLVYMSYPFLIQLNEAIGWIFLPSYWIWLGVALHLMIIVSVGIRFGAKYSLYYVLFFFIFLLPIIMISVKGAHYLYGSSLSISVVLAALIHFKGRFHRPLKFFSYIILIIFTLHSYRLQIFVYDLGTCMDRTLISAESLYITYDKPKKVVFQAEPGAQEHILHRIVTGRNHIGESFSTELSVSKFGALVEDESSLILTMNKQCYLYKLNKH